jgi:Leucine-rich repeat (LRR) protein
VGNLKSLGIGDNSIGDAGAEEFMSTGNLTNLRELNLSVNGISDSMQERLEVWAQENQISLEL